MFSKKTVIWLLILSCTLVLLSIPRFNRNDKGFKSLTTDGTGKLGDAAQYTAMTQYFRGESTIDDLHTPFTYRPLIPFLAALLPFDAMTAINLINLTALLVTIIFLYLIMVWLGIDFTYSIIGCGIFVVSFPTFYYSAIGYIDPVLICLLTIGLYFIFTNNWIALAGVIITGAFVKETVLILILLLAAYLIFNRKLFSKQGLILLSLSIVFLISYYAARRIIPMNPTIGWMPSFEILIFNLSRLRSWLSFLLTFGVPGVFALLIFRYRATSWFHENFAETATLITGFFISILLFGYSMLSAHADGRFIWTSYPFSVPLAVIVLSEIRKSRLVNRKAVQ
jgi:hypothetical protein